MYKDSAANDIRGLKNDARSTANDVKEDLHSFANNAGKKVRNLFDSTSDEFNHVSETVTTRINDKPLQSALIALGVGYVLGALMRR